MKRVVFLIALMGILNATDEVQKEYLKYEKLEAESRYLDDIKHKILITYYKNGKIKSKAQFYNDKRHGKTTMYYEDGKILYIAPYSNGHLNGVAIEYYPNGHIKFRVQYFNGKKNGIEQIYNKDGTLRLERTYTKDLLDRNSKIDTIKYIMEAEQTKNSELNSSQFKHMSSQDIFRQCGACHGTKGIAKALGKSEIIAGQSADEIERKLKEYKMGARDTTGNGALMKGQVVNLSDKQIKALSIYISQIK